MMRRCTIPLLLATAVALFALSGCGGSGGSGGDGSNPSGGTSTMGVFVTDNFGDQYSQVWITLYKIEATTNGTTFITLYDNPAGQAIDLSSLSDAAQLLANVTVPAGTYTQVRITFGDQLTLVPRGSQIGVLTPVDASTGTHANGMVTITLAAPTPAASGQLANLVIDFDLAAFEIVGGHVRPHIIQGDHGHFQQVHHNAELEGTVSNLVAGTSFDLVGGNGQTTTIDITSDTSIFSAHMGTNATLANGQRVVVKGTVNADTHVVTADSIKINDSNGQNGEHENVEAEGTVGTVTVSNSSFTLTVTEAEHFAPTGATITVITNGDTHFHMRHHETTSFADIVSGATVGANGTFDATTQTLTAKRVEIK